MNRSNYDYDGIIYSDMVVSKQDDGKYKAHFPAVPAIPPALGRDEQEAISLAKAAIEDAHSKGTLGS